MRVAVSSAKPFDRLFPEALSDVELNAARSSRLILLFVLPVGGADAPPVIALLNFRSGLAPATGFVLDNNVLLIVGSLVGASGFILAQIMCRAL
jgi:NAD/NADP transhydrogenase beta subunit